MDHVKTCLAQVRARALLESARACGVSSLAWSENCGPLGSSWKTLRAEPEDGLTPSCLSWAGKAMHAYRSRCRRAMSALRTGVAESSLLPTLTVEGNYNRKGMSLSSGDGLRTALLPTLSASSYGSNKGGAAGRDGQPDRPSIETMAKRGMLPTLTTRDEKGPGPKHTRGSRDLPQELGGHLNPEWCLWFMGFEAGYLAVDDAHVFGRSVTALFRNKRRLSGGSSKKSKRKRESKKRKDLPDPA